MKFFVSLARLNKINRIKIMMEKILQMLWAAALVLALFLL